MIVGVATGLAGVLLHSTTLKTVAVLSLALGVGIGFLPLAAAGIHSLYVWFRGRGSKM
jgi:hypothetical protein